MGAEERRIAVNPRSAHGQNVPAGNARLRQAAGRLAEDGIQVLDLSGIFEGVEDIRFKGDCCHFNVAGNSALAEALADAILAGLE